MQNVADNHFALPVRIPGMHHNPDIFTLYQNLQNLKLLPLSGINLPGFAVLPQLKLKFLRKERQPLHRP